MDENAIEPNPLPFNSVLQETFEETGRGQKLLRALTMKSLTRHKDTEGIDNRVVTHTCAVMHEILFMNHHRSGFCRIFSYSFIFRATSDRKSEFGFHTFARMRNGRSSFHHHLAV